MKEMRLRGISDMSAGNAYLPEFMADFNRRFAVAPRSPEDAHRAVLRDAEELDLIFCEHHRRKLTKNLTIRFECREYQMTGRGKGYRLRGAEVTVCKAFDGSVTVLREGRELPARLLAEGEEPIPVEDGKTVRGRVDAAEGGAAGAAGLQAAAGPSLAATVQGPPPRARRPEDEAASAGGRAVDLWTSPADRRAPFGPCGQPVDNRARPPRRRSGVPPRVAHRLPTLARLSPTTPQLKQQVFLLEEEKSPNCKKGTFQLWRKGDISTLG